MALLLFLLAAWFPADLPAGSVADVAAHPSISGLVFALMPSGIYRSSDAGKHWTQVSNAGLSTIAFIPLHALAFDPFDDRRLCALGNTLMSCSSDLGTTWEPLPQPGLTFLLFDPATRQRMFMGTPYGMDWVFVSSDRGLTWSPRGAFDVHPWFHGSAAADPRSGALIETGSPHGGCIPLCSLFRSDDGGFTWMQIVSEEDAWTFAEDRSGRSALYAITSGSVSVSTNLGATFETRGQVPSPVTVLASDPNDVAILYASGDGGILLKSVDGGRNWTRIDRSEIGDRVMHISVGIDGGLYVATQDKVFVQSKRRRAVRSGM